MLKFDDDEAWHVDAAKTYLVAGMIGSRDQAIRWQSLGFDHPAAVAREADFLGRYQAALDLDGSQPGLAPRLMTEFVESESRIAVQSGVSRDDPDFWRLASAHKYLDTGPSFTTLARPPAPAGGLFQI